MNRLSILVVLIVLVATLSGCSNIDLKQRRTASSQLAPDAGWRRLNIEAGLFVLASFVPPNPKQAENLTIYIEGDGLAWISSVDVSPDPTPIHPTGLQMALRHPQGNAAYLARPCQYVEGADRRNCTSTWWTDRRFAPEVIDATNHAVEQLKQRFNARRLVLVGYSGGGAVATLVAARRQDVSMLVTVAGNLDPDLWAKTNYLSPLSGSLNPKEHWKSLIQMQQLHFIGNKDRIIPRVVTESFVQAFPEKNRPEIRVIDGFDHSCCWAEKWGEIYRPPMDSLQ